MPDERETFIYDHFRMISHRLDVCRGDFFAILYPLRFTKDWAYLVTLGSGKSRSTASVYSRFGGSHLEVRMRAKSNKSLAEWCTFRHPFYAFFRYFSNYIFRVFSWSISQWYITISLWMFEIKKNTRSWPSSEEQMLNHIKLAKKS